MIYLDLPADLAPDQLIPAINERLRRLSATAAQAAPASSETRGAVTSIAESAGFAILHAQRATYSAGASPNAFLVETDRGLLYQSQASQWRYVSGVMSVDFAGIPGDLTANDAGLLCRVTGYEHTLRWDGGGWAFADAQGGWIAGRVAAPDGDGWQVCDGSATTYLHIFDGIVIAVVFTTPNLIGTPAFPKFGAAYTGTITAATAPTISAPALTMNSYTPAGTVSQPTFTGSALGTHAHATAMYHSGSAVYFAIPGPWGTRTISAALTHYATGTASTNASPEPFDLSESVSAGTPAGTVSQPTFTGTPATLTGTISAPTATLSADPVARIVLLPYFRR